jgi:hypothetical protein
MTEMNDNWKEQIRLGMEAYNPLDEASEHTSKANFVIAQACEALEEIAFGIRNTTADDIQRMENILNEAMREIHTAVPRLDKALSNLAAYRRVL